MWYEGSGSGFVSSVADSIPTHARYARQGAKQQPSPNRGIDAGDDWMSRFHRGGRDTFAALYVNYLDTVERAVRGIVNSADRETVVHEVFLRLMSDAETRRRYNGGSFSAWMRTLARNRAIDFRRRRRFERLMGGDPEGFDHLLVTQSFEASVLARTLLERFRRAALPAKWQRVFEARFVAHLDQTEAADALCMSRTTLAYQEYRIRRRLQRFVLAGGGA